MKPSLGFWPGRVPFRQQALLDAFDCYEPHLLAFAAREKIPETALPALTGAALGLASFLLWRKTSHPEPLIVGIQGAQGSGKTTLASLVSDILLKVHHCPNCLLSLDDFYLTREERQHLALRIHPLFATRGVPGTHDLALLNDTLDRLITAQPETLTRIPRFDKSRDDRVLATDWLTFSGRPPLILLEGWCIGTAPEPLAQRMKPINALEAEEDRDGVWRQTINTQLEGAYAALFRRLGALIMLRIPSFDSVSVWRSLQESKLETPSSDSRQMNPAEMARFIQHFERLTRWSLESTPQRADLVFDVNGQHEIIGVTQALRN